MPRIQVVHDRVDKPFWADPLALGPERIIKITLENQGESTATFVAYQDSADSASPSFEIRPPHGIIPVGETACVEVFSLDSCWIALPIGIDMAHELDPGRVVQRASVRVLNRTAPPKEAAERLRAESFAGLSVIAAQGRSTPPCDGTLHSTLQEQRRPTPETDIVFATENRDALTVDPAPPSRKRLDRAEDAPRVVSHGLVLRTSPAAPFVPGDHYTFFLGLDGDLPEASPLHHYQFAVVLDADDDTSNNYVPPAAFPGDYFQGTDLWYEVTYTPAGGWTLDVTDARNNVFTPVVSGARAVVVPRGVYLIIPAAKVPADRPAYRLTAFRHEGDFGLNPPFAWSANTAPTMDQPLRRFGDP